MEFLHYGKYPNNDIWIWISIQRVQVSARCRDRGWIEELQKEVINPQPFERFIEFVGVLDGPFEYALYDNFYSAI
jgi:hypothetical protein